MWRRRKQARELDVPTPLQREWTDPLQRHGSVEVGTSRWRLLTFILMSAVFVTIGVAMLVWSSGSGRVIGGLAVGVFGLCLVAFVATLVRGGPVLVADRTGMHLPRRTPLDIPWEQVVDLGSARVNRLSAPQLLVRVWPQTLEGYAGRQPLWQRVLTRLSQRGRWRDTVVIQFFAAPIDELVLWLDEQVDLLASVPHELVMIPAAGVSPVWGARSLRPIALDKLHLSTELGAAVEDFDRRVAPVAEEITAGGSPGARWGSLAAEGRELCGRLERELGAGYSVVWVEDGPRDPG